MKKVLLTLVCCATLLAACGPRKSAAPARQIRQFPHVEVPSVLTEPSEKLEYMFDRYWDGFFAGGGTTDTGAVLGVPRPEVETAVATYLTLMDNMPMEKAQAGIRSIFSRIEKAQAADTASHVYLLMTEILSDYLYDPNSPYRNEDYYLPLVEAMAVSPYSRDDMRAGYRYQARVCGINRKGSQAPDFAFTDIRGREHRLHSIKAEYTLLFFSNPGCHACREIIETITSRPYVDPFIASGRLAVVNIYIDEEIDAWKAYEPNYPRNWSTGYDSRKVIRDTELYNVRAIPSLYLLDADKRIIMKDAPTEKVMAFLDKYANTKTQ